MLCIRCGVDVGDTLGYCDDCAALVAEEKAAQSKAPSEASDEFSEANSDFSQEIPYYEDEPNLSLGKVFIFLFVPVLIGIGMVIWVLMENGLLEVISKKSGVDKLVEISPVSKKSPRVVSKKIKFELGVDGVTGLLTIQGTQVPMWRHEIALQQPERNIAIRFAENSDSAQSLARPASQKLGKPMLLKLRLKTGEEVCSVKSLVGYLLLIDYGGETIRISRLNTSADSMGDEVSDFECALSLGSEMRGKFKGEDVSESGIAVAWNLEVAGQIAALE